MMIIAKKNILPNIIIWLNIVHFTTFAIWPVFIRAICYVFILVGFCMFFLETNFKSKILRCDRLGIIVIIYTLYVLFNAIIMYDGMYKFLAGMYEYIFYPMMGLACMYVFSRVRISKIENYMCLMSIITSIIAVYEFYFNIYLISNTGFLTWTNEGDTIFRAMAFSTSPMTLGMLIDIYIITALKRYLITKQKKFLFVLFINILSLLASYSRGPLVGLIVSFIFVGITYIVDYGKKKIKARYVFAIIIYIVLFILIIQYNSNVFSNISLRIESIFDWQNNEANLGRLIAWSTSLNIIFSSINNFILGIGVASTGAYGLGDFSNFVTESGVLKRFVEGGIIMLILNYSMIGIILYRGIKQYFYDNSANKITIISSIACLVAILVEDVVLQVTEDVSTSFFFWMNVAILLMTKSYQKS